MSLCIRTISNKLTPFVGTRKPITQLDRQLPKHLKETSAFLQEFLAARASVNSQIRNGTASFHLMMKPQKTSENIVDSKYKLRRDGNWNISRNETTTIKEFTKKLSDRVCEQDAAGTVFSVGEKDHAVQLEKKTDGELQQDSDKGHGKPSPEQLNHVCEVLREDLPMFFARSLNYRIYHPDIVFENNIKGVTTKGIYAYVKQVALLRMAGHVKFAFVKFEILKITVHPEDDSVKVRWRIRGISGYKLFFLFWRYKVWNLNPAINQFESWYDGFSTFYVNGDGIVIKHVADKMMPDQDTELSTKDKTGIAARLALCLGLLAPREFLADISPLMYRNITAARGEKC